MDNSEQISPDVDELLLEIAWEDYRSFSEDKRDLEFKASIIFAGVGILLGLILGSLDKLNYTFALISSILLVFSGLLCILVFYMRTYKTIDALSVYEYLKSKNSLHDIKTAKNEVWYSLDDFTKKNRKIYTTLANYMKIIIPIFFLSILMLFLSIFVKKICFY